MTYTVSGGALNYSLTRWKSALIIIIISSSSGIM